MTPVAWECRAKPASLGGRPCGHVNAAGGQRTRFGGVDLVYCESCGRTRHASDDRAKREAGGRP